MICAIPLAEKVLAGLATIGAKAANSALSDTRKIGAAGAADFANTLQQARSDRRRSKSPERRARARRERGACGRLTP